LVGAEPLPVPVDAFGGAAPPLTLGPASTPSRRSEGPVVGAQAEGPLSAPAPVSVSDPERTWRRSVCRQTKR
jgi:hypothetical protein